jgi:hypothetical protein
MKFGAKNDHTRIGKSTKANNIRKPRKLLKNILDYGEICSNRLDYI